MIFLLLSVLELLLCYSCSPELSFVPAYEIMMFPTATATQSSELNEGEAQESPAAAEKPGQMRARSLWSNLGITPWRLTIPPALKSFSAPSYSNPHPRVFQGLSSPVPCSPPLLLHLILHMFTSHWLSGQTNPLRCQPGASLSHCFLLPKPDVKS